MARKGSWVEMLLSNFADSFAFDLRRERRAGGRSNQSHESTYFCILSHFSVFLSVSSMGVNGLLGFLRPTTKDSSIQEYNGKSLGIDASCYLYKGAYSCATELALGISTNK